MNSPLDRIAAAELGLDPAAAAADPAAQPPAPQKPPSSDGNPPTPEEKAQAAAAPKTEGDAMDADPFFEIDMGEGRGKRKLTPTQIRSTMERYADLNDTHSELKPIIELAKNLVAQTKAKPDQLAAFMVEAMRKATSSNVEMGGDGKKSGRPGEDTPPAKDDGADPFAEWEREHQVALPPGYREQKAAFDDMKSSMTAMMSMMQAVLSAAKGAGGDVETAAADAAKTRAAAVREKISRNLDVASEKNGITEENLEDFQAFMAERGYGLEDFVDPELADRVVADFAAALNKPEFDRIRDIHKRRSAVAGSLAASPTGGDMASPPPADPNKEMLGRLAAQKLGAG